MYIPIFTIILLSMVLNLKLLIIVWVISPLFIILSILYLATYFILPIAISVYKIDFLFGLLLIHFINLRMSHLVIKTIQTTVFITTTFLFLVSSSFLCFLYFSLLYLTQITLLNMSEMKIRNLLNIFVSEIVYH